MMYGGGIVWVVQGFAEICIITQTKAVLNAPTRQQTAQQNPKVLNININ